MTDTYEYIYASVEDAINATPTLIKPGKQNIYLIFGLQGNDKYLSLEVKNVSEKKYFLNRGYFELQKLQGVKGRPISYKEKADFEKPVSVEQVLNAYKLSRFVTIEPLKEKYAYLIADLDKYDDTEVALQVRFGVPVVESVGGKDLLKFYDIKGEILYIPAWAPYRLIYLDSKNQDGSAVFSEPEFDQYPSNSAERYIVQKYGLAVVAEAEDEFKTYDEDGNLKKIDGSLSVEDFQNLLSSPSGGSNQKPPVIVKPSKTTINPPGPEQLTEEQVIKRLQSVTDLPKVLEVLEKASDKNAPLVRLFTNIYLAKVKKNYSAFTQTEVNKASEFAEKKTVVFGDDVIKQIHDLDVSAKKILSTERFFYDIAFENLVMLFDEETDIFKAHLKIKRVFFANTEEALSGIRALSSDFFLNDYEESVITNLVGKAVDGNGSFMDGNGKYSKTRQTPFDTQEEFTEFLKAYDIMLKSFKPGFVEKLSGVSRETKNALYFLNEEVKAERDILAYANAKEYKTAFFLLGQNTLVAQKLKEQKAAEEQKQLAQKKKQQDDDQMFGDIIKDLSDQDQKEFLKEKKEELEKFLKERNQLEFSVVKIAAENKIKDKTIEELVGNLETKTKQVEALNAQILQLQQTPVESTRLLPVQSSSSGPGSAKTKSAPLSKEDKTKQLSELKRQLIELYKAQEVYTYAQMFKEADDAFDKIQKKKDEIEKAETSAT